MYTFSSVTSTAISIDSTPGPTGLYIYICHFENILSEKNEVKQGKEVNKDMIENKHILTEIIICQYHFCNVPYSR